MARLIGIASTVWLIAICSCEKEERPGPPIEVEPESEPEPIASSPDARDAAGAVAFLEALCAKVEDHPWVSARVTLPLRGIHTLSALEADALLHPNENDSVEDFKYTRYCGMMPAAGTLLRDFKVTPKSSSGLVNFGKVPHRIVFDLTSEPPRLVEIDAQLETKPIPSRPDNVRDYELVAPPRGFTDREPPGASALRRKTIKLLKADPRCIENYVASDVSVARFRVIVNDNKPRTVSVMPFQLVRSSLIACLRTQLATSSLAASKPTSAIIELIIPISADELPADTATLKMKPSY